MALFPYQIEAIIQHRKILEIFEKQKKLLRSSEIFYFTSQEKSLIQEEYQLLDELCKSYEERIKHY